MKLSLPECEICLICDFDVENPKCNSRQLRLAIGGFSVENIEDKIRKIVYVTVYGYGGGGVQESRSYKIVYPVTGLIEVFSALVNPDVWEKKFTDVDQSEIENQLTKVEYGIFEKIQVGLDKWLVTVSDLPGCEDYPNDQLVRLSAKYLFTKDDHLYYYISKNFDYKWLKHLYKHDYPFMTKYE